MPSELAPPVTDAGFTVTDDTPGTGFTVSVTVATPEGSKPSVARYVKESGPEYPDAGV